MTGFDELFAGAEIISSYSQQQAIEDGVLSRTTDLVPDEPGFTREAGFTCPVLLTAGVADIVLPNDREMAEWHQDIKGRLWDLLMMARFAKPHQLRPGSTWTFECIFVLIRDGQPQKRPTLSFVAHIGPGDIADPVVTIMLPHED